MSFTYTYQKGCSAPTHFLVNTGFSKSLYKTICFDHTIKTFIPTPRGLHQSINGSSRGRRTLIVVLLSTKLNLSKGVFDKFKMLTTMRFSHSYRCLKSVRIMLTIATFYEIWQMDVKTAFLNGFVKEELYMIQQESFINPKGANKVCKLQRSIYGLVQASRSWNICFYKVIMVLYRLAVKPVFTRKWVGALRHFW